MLKSELEHIIRATSAITNQYEIIVVGCLPVDTWLSGTAAS